jgi:hypothetical protein
MIEPLAKGEPYPGRLPPLRKQWLRVPLGIRYTVVAVPLLVVGLCFVASITLGVVMAVFVGGVGAATVVYIKNRTDRHNAAIDRGEIRVVADPHLRAVASSGLDPAVVDRLGALGYAAGDIGRVTRFDEGWIVKRRDARAISVVVGDDGEFARFDPTRVDDLRAAAEYQAGRGREPTGF